MAGKRIDPQRRRLDASVRPFRAEYAAPVVASSATSTNDRGEFNGKSTEGDSPVPPETRDYGEGDAQSHLPSSSQPILRQRVMTTPTAGRRAGLHHHRVGYGDADKRWLGDLDDGLSSTQVISVTQFMIGDRIRWTLESERVERCLVTTMVKARRPGSPSIRPLRSCGRLEKLPS